MMFPRRPVYLLCRRLISVGDVQPMTTFTYQHNCRRFAFFDARDKDLPKKEKRLTLHHRSVFQELAKKERNKATYKKAIAKYLTVQGKQRRGHVEFIYAALDEMKEFGVEKDINTYKQLIDLFPKRTMVATSTWQSDLMHYPKQQQCLIDLFDAMESNGVIPDDDIGYSIIKIFGRNTHPFRKYQRMMYWMPKFKYANPYYIPHILPEDPMDLAVLALKRMAVDLENKVTIFQTNDIDNSIEDTYIVSAQSPIQEDLLADHSPDVPIYVEGGFTTWLRDKSLTYFILRSEQTDRYRTFAVKKDEDQDEDKLNFSIFEEEPTAVVVPPTCHEQEDGTILGMCITGTSTKDSLASWIKVLQGANPKLATIPILFLLSTPERGLQVFRENKEHSDVAQT